MKDSFYYQREESVPTELDNHRKNTAAGAFKAGIWHALMRTSRIFLPSLYKKLPDQQNAVASVYQMVADAGGIVVRTGLFEKPDYKDYIVETHTQFDVAPALYGACFKTPVSPDDKGVVKITFITGLHELMHDLFPNNDLVASAVEQFSPEKMFDAEHVIPVLLRNNGLKRMTLRREMNQKLSDVAWYANESGEFFGIKIEGYSTTLKNPQPKKNTSKTKAVTPPKRAVK